MRAQDILRAEFIGKPITATSGTTTGTPPIVGKVIDETKHTIVIKTTKGPKRLLKKNHTFTITIDTKTYDIKGVLLEKRPQDRIKIKT